MSNKLIATDKGYGKNRKNEKERTDERFRWMIEYLLAAVVFILCVVVPLYAKNGYHQIGNAKFEAYCRIITGGFAVLLFPAALYFVCRLTDSGRSRRVGREDAGKRPAVSLTDKFVFLYLILTGISVLSGGFYEDALWGAYGWNMGLFSQVSFVLLYLFLSRFGRYYRVMLGGLCGTAAIVFLIGILHRLMIDPTGFYDELTNEQRAQFLSTLGQATWYAAFLAVTLPVGVSVFLYAEKRGMRTAGGIYTALGFCTLVTQNSDSAYFALAGMLLVFFMVSCEKREWTARFLAALAMFFAAGKIMGLLMRMRPNPALRPDPVTELMWTSGFTWVLLGLCLAGIFLAGHGRGRKGSWRQPEYPQPAVRRARRLVMGTAAAFVVMAAAVIWLQGQGALPAAFSDRIAAISYLNWNDDWGNGRGRIWEFTCRMLSQESLPRRFFGVGPDCFHSYVSAFHGEEAALLWGEKQLTNAHNEWLNMLVNGGILGTAAYLGIYVSMVCRCLRNRERNLLLTGIAAACVSYMCYNFFCYQQVLCTPFIFILMGTGEYLLRKEQGETPTAGDAGRKTAENK